MKRVPRSILLSGALAFAILIRLASHQRRLVPEAFFLL